MRTTEELIKILRNYNPIFVGKDLMLEIADRLEYFLNRVAELETEVEQLKNQRGNWYER